MRRDRAVVDQSQEGDDVAHVVLVADLAGREPRPCGEDGVVVDPAGSAEGPFHLSELFLLQSAAAAANNTYVLRNGIDWRWTYDDNPFTVWPPASLHKSTTYGSPVDDDLNAVCNPL